MGYDLKYGHIYAERKEIPDGEPVFLLRGQDKIACLVVRLYATLYIAITKDKLGHALILKQVQNMEEWEVKKYPD